LVQHVEFCRKARGIVFNAVSTGEVPRHPAAAKSKANLPSAAGLFRANPIC
jgi:hypothetical protein